MTGALEANHQQDGEGNGRARSVDRRLKRRGYRRSGFYALKTTLRALGPRVLDRRTTLGKQLAGWKADLIRDLGGDVSTQQAAIVDLAVRTKLLLDSVDAWLLVQPSLVNARKKALLPVVRERQQLADSLARMLERLGQSSGQTSRGRQARAGVGVTILEAMRLPALFGAVFGDGETWPAWQAFLAAVFGLTMSDPQLALYRHHTGRSRPPAGAVARAG